MSFGDCGSPWVRITDSGDVRLAGYRDLTDRRARQRIEGNLGVFIVEGVLALGQLLASGYDVESILVATTRAEQVRGFLGLTAAPVYLAEPAVLASTAGFDVHRGVLALGRRRPAAAAADVLATAVATDRPTVVVTEGVNDHENLGAIFRNAAAFGVGAVLADPTTCDPLYRRSIRVSLGYALRVPFARLIPWPAALDELGRAGWTILALSPSAESEDLDVVAGEGLARVAILVGAEGPGLRPETLAGADRRIRVPMAVGVDSLNVATAAAIAFHRLVPRLSLASGSPT